MITKAVHTRKCCVLKVQNDNGMESEIVLKLNTPCAANALYRCLTEMHSFYLCDTVHNEVSMQFSRDLKGTLASIFYENTTLGKYMYIAVGLDHHLSQLMRLWFFVSSMNS